MKKVKSVCPYCGVGCGIVMEVDGDRIVRVSGDKQHPSNAGRLCTKGSTSHLAIQNSGRMERAYQRPVRNAEPQLAPLADVIDHTAGRLRRIMEEHGPDAISLYVSGQMSLEAQYLANKLAKGFIGTNQIESNSRLCMASAATGYKLSLGADAPPGSYEDLDHADLFFVSGANMADCHPVLYLRMMDRVKQGARLIVVDPRRTATADKADLYLPIRPGTDLALLNGLLHLIWQNGDCDQAFIDCHTQGWEAMPAFLAQYTPERVATITGIDEADIRKAAAWMEEAKNWMSCWTMGLNQSTHGTWNTNAICNLHLATGTICRRGSGPFSLTGQPNAMGGREMGYMGPGLPGQRSVLNADDRAFVEAAWHLSAGTLHTRLGKGTVGMFDDMQAGRIKACWIICTNPIASVPNRERVIRALQNAELVIVQDAYLDTETSRYADVLLPAALWAEGDGVMINSERTMTLAPKAVNPPGEALPDWLLIARVAQAMGYDGFDFVSAAQVFEEIRAFSNPQTGYDIRGATHERLRESPLQWPCASAGATARNPVRYVTSVSPREDNAGQSPTTLIRFPTASGKAQFLARPHLDAEELPDADHPFLLNTGRLQHQWHTLTKTGKVAALNKLNPAPFIEIHDDDAKALEVKTGEHLAITSRRGRAVLPVKVSDRVQPGNAFTPFHWNDLYGENLAINALTNDAVDPLSQQPELKICAVSLTKVTLLEHQFLQTTDRRKTGIGVERQEDMRSFALEGANPDGLAMSKMERAWLSGFMQATRTWQAAGLPCSPIDAPLEPSTRRWLDQWLASLRAQTPPASVAVDEVTVLWASQTGSAEAAAAQIVGLIHTSGRRATTHCMAEFSLAQLARCRTVLLVSSTFGDGDAPDNGEDFWRALRDSDTSLASLRFAVFALGDSSYEQFCKHGRNLHAALCERGAHALLPVECCDGTQATDVERWVHRLSPSLGMTTASDQAKVAHTGLATSELNAARPIAARPIAAHPTTARVTGNRRLSATGSNKETRAFTLTVDDAPLAYEAGDSLGVWARNCPELVKEVLDGARLNGERLVTVPVAGDMSLREALSRHYEIARPSAGVLELIAQQHGNDALRMRLANSVAMKEWLWGLQLADVLQQHPTSLDADELLASLKPLQPRLYSISSSAKLHPNEVHLTVSTVRYGTRKGVASTFLADRSDRDPVSIFVQKSRDFRPPAGEASVIMIGPGTGVAPFRAFLQERGARGDTGRNWLFFGEQHQATDFYYRDELLSMQNNGLLTRLSLAFSRDQARRIYVQDRMREQGEELWRWLEDGAYLFVCGDASRMAKDVDRALHDIASCVGGLDQERATQYVRQLAQQKRYVRDVY
jgi:sulfite reductase (NADPH) flavoprotein alpha-component